jgi:hypothetical protein
VRQTGKLSPLEFPQTIEATWKKPAEELYSM